MGWIGCVPSSTGTFQIFFIFSGYFFLKDFINDPQIRNARAFLPLHILAVGSVDRHVAIFKNSILTVKQLNWKKYWILTWLTLTLDYPIGTGTMIPLCLTFLTIFICQSRILHMRITVGSNGKVGILKCYLYVKIQIQPNIKGPIFL